jgi:hydroxypyruvate reductase
MSTGGKDERLREDALSCLRTAIAAVEPEQLVYSHLLSGEDPLQGVGQVHVAAIGKAAQAMARGAAAALGERSSGGVVVMPPGISGPLPDRYRSIAGGHPVPHMGSVEAGRAVLELAEGLAADDLLLCLISGGGSALMTLPPKGVTLGDVQLTTEALLRAGATIGELNAVRKHLDRLKGGRLARAAMPARILALVLSDVVGDPLDVIASGPMSPDPTSFADAVEVIRRRDLWSELPEGARAQLEAGLRGEAEESPKQGDPCFERVRVRIIGNNRLAAGAALAKAEQLGYSGQLLTTELTGEASEVGRDLARQALRERAGSPPGPHCLVAAGETTVTVTGTGSGGRNQELALGAALALDGSEGILLASVGTDGIDGPTDAAGAFADDTTVARADARGIDPEAVLRANNTYAFFCALEDIIVTGRTGTNVMDLQVVLWR